MNLLAPGSTYKCPLLNSHIPWIYLLTPSSGASGAHLVLLQGEEEGRGGARAPRTKFYRDWRIQPFCRNCHQLTEELRREDVATFKNLLRFWPLLYKKFPGPPSGPQTAPWTDLSLVAGAWSGVGPSLGSSSPPGVVAVPLTAPRPTSGGGCWDCYSRNTLVFRLIFMGCLE